MQRISITYYVEYSDTTMTAVQLQQ